MPSKLDYEFYRQQYDDLKPLTDEELEQHYREFGVAEGRIPNALDAREHLLSIVAESGDVLEIGPFFNPTIAGENVSYFDVLDQNALRARAKDHSLNPDNVPYIDYVSPIGDLSVVDHQFAAAISSHCIEHQPNLVGHLHQVEQLLIPGGSYFLIVPDKRYCFDSLLAESTSADIIGAHIEGRKRHAVAHIIEHRAMTTHNDPQRHWQGDHTEPRSDEERQRRIRQALQEVSDAGEDYIDVHAWKFTPDCFHKILDDLAALELTGLSIDYIGDTPSGRNEFTAVLKKQ
ncbi:MAG: hypothetical protein AAF668_07025 [Pseudomonadota bacterium]